MLAPPELETIIIRIRGQHRTRRFAMKTQQKLDRSLESFVRCNYTDWHPDMPEKERDAINKRIKAMIKNARDTASELTQLVDSIDKGRAPFDSIRDDCERDMETLAKQLPVYSWVAAIPGAAALGLATIIAETGDLSNYSNVAKVWKRLGYAPYDGLAGSTWKRETWRTRTLTKEEWIENPFSGERYALIQQIGESLFKKQWIGKERRQEIEAALKEAPDASDETISKLFLAKEDSKRISVATVKTVRTYLAMIGDFDDGGEGVPCGTYGQVYADRRAQTKIERPEWTPGHANKDALRIMLKEYLKHLFLEWRRLAGADAKNTDQTRSLVEPKSVLSDRGRPAMIDLKPKREVPAAKKSKRSGRPVAE
jgi:hypothetical protein